jgi:hypothetical protein
MPHFVPWRAVTTCHTEEEGAEQSSQKKTQNKTSRGRWSGNKNATEKSAPVSYVQPVIRPIAGKHFFGDSACQPQVRRRTPRIKNHRHIDCSRGVHQQARTRHDRNAKQTVPCSISRSFFTTGGGGCTVARLLGDDANFVPRHLRTAV